MKMIILAGGQRSTLSDVAEALPKPMLPIGGRPLLWHIMKHASLCGIRDFVICGGYKIELIKDYFLDFYIYQSDILVDTGNNTVEILDKNTEDWKVTIVDTGVRTMPTERVKRVLEMAGDEFLITYGDCLSDISIERLIETHKREEKELTVAVAKPSGRKVPLHFFNEDETEWGSRENAWTSAGIFAAKRNVFENCNCEGDIEDLLTDGGTAIYKHVGFFSTIETLRDKTAAEEMWENGKAPWVSVV